ncbi:MAG: hypothetical protein H6766_00010 [Candidatus Peribacteria bacterium]|nr:MAG: hypothetical protein H6766_00010 [Candidatus Peribacteria bacterium]
MNEQNLLTNGQVTLPLDVTDDQAAVIAPLLRYFEDTNGRGLPQLNPERSNANELFVHTTMDRYADRGTNREVEDTYKFFHQKQNTIDSTGYTTLHTNLDYSTRNDNNANPSYTDTTWTYTSNNTSYTIDLSSIIEALSRINNSQELPTEWSIVESANARLIIATISIKKEGEKRILEDISGNLLVK